MFLNKRMVTRQRIEPFTNISQNGRLEVAPQFLETLPNGRTYKILEKNEDKDFIWRKHVNEKLKKEYKKIFPTVVFLCNKQIL